MYDSAGSVGKTVLLAVHLDPGERTYGHGLCPITSPAWSCQHKGHWPPWGPPVLHQGVQAACLGVFLEVLPPGLGWWGLCVTGCEFLLPVVLSGCSGVFPSAPEAPGHSPGQPSSHAGRSRDSGWYEPGGQRAEMLSVSWEMRRCFLSWCRSIRYIQLESLKRSHLTFIPPAGMT